MPRAATRCATCGKQLGPDWAFCIHCGNAVPTTPVAATSSGLGAKIAAGVLVAALAGGGAWLVTSPESPLRSAQADTGSAGAPPGTQLPVGTAAEVSGTVPPSDAAAESPTATTPAAAPGGSAVNLDEMGSWITITGPEIVQYGTPVTYEVSVVNPTDQRLGLAPQTPNAPAEWAPSWSGKTRHGDPTQLGPGETATWLVSVTAADANIGLGWYDLTVKVSGIWLPPSGDRAEAVASMSVETVPHRFWVEPPTIPPDDVWNDLCTIEKTMEQIKTIKASAIRDGESPAVEEADRILAEYGTAWEQVYAAMTADGVCVYEAFNCWCYRDDPYADHCLTSCGGGIAFGGDEALPALDPQDWPWP